MNRQDITGVILAGGRGRRVQGEDKGLLPLAGRPLVAHTLACLAPQVANVVLSANRNLDRYYGFGLTVVTDTDPSYPGPLAGIAAAMDAATTPLLATTPCDIPFLPGDWVERLFRSLQGAPLCVAYDGVRRQPLVALLRCELRGDLLAFLGAGGHAVRDWQARHRCAIADFSDIPDAFWNVNRTEDLVAAEARLRPEQQAPTG